MATTQFAVANSHLQKIQPDILGFGITDFGDQMQFWYIFHQSRGVNDANKIVAKNNAKLYDFLKKAWPEYMQPQKITQAKNLNFEEMQCKANVRFTRGKQWF